jgi:transposase-like protein
MPQYISDEVKQEIIKKVREENVSVSDASVEAGVSTKTIYNWLRDGASNGSQNLILENRKLKKETEQLYAMLGKATAYMQRPKGWRS